MTDRDGDSDLDLLVPGDLGPPIAFWRNDLLENGEIQWHEDAGDLGADLSPVAAMGIDSADLNNDQRMDYCVSDVGPPTCLISLPEFDSFYFEGSTSLGLTVDNWIDRFGTIGWSLDFNDLNNDGQLDLVQASAPDPTSFHEGILEYPDIMWLGQPDGRFRDVSDAAGFSDTAWHMGLATADFDNDGWLDIIVSGPDELPKLWMNRCGHGHWLGVDLIGVGNNVEAYGARVEVRAGSNTWTRELTNLRGRGQRPSRLHFGLGAHERVDSVEVTWPNGEKTLIQEVEIDRWITASQADM